MYTRIVEYMTIFNVNFFRMNLSLYTLVRKGHLPSARLGYSLSAENKPV